MLGTVVQHSLTPAMIPDQTYQGLAARAGTWPQPWRAAVLDCLERRTLVGTPVKEYVPERLTRGRLALVGDAAHVPSPITGSGFSASLADAAAMADVLDEATADAVPRALEQYERRRLAEVRRMVVDGQSFSRAFGQP